MAPLKGTATNTELTRGHFPEKGKLHQCLYHFPRWMNVRAMLTILWEDVEERPDIAALLKRLLTAARVATCTAASVEVTVLLTSDARLQELNRTYRGKDAPTDVLSFAHRDTRSPDAGCKPALPPENCEYLGDIAISLARVKTQAAEYGHSEERELAYLFVHGFLHLLGHTHDQDAAYTKMRAREEAILNSAGLPRSTSPA